MAMPMAVRQALEEMYDTIGVVSERLDEIGVEMDNYYYSATAHLVLAREMPGADLRDASGLVNWQRAVKSGREVEYMRRAARIVEHMHARIRELAPESIVAAQDGRD